MKTILTSSYIPLCAIMGLHQDHNQTIVHFIRKKLGNNNCLAIERNNTDMKPNNLILELVPEYKGHTKEQFNHNKTRAAYQTGGPL